MPGPEECSPSGSGVRLIQLPSQPLRTRNGYEGKEEREEESMKVVSLVNQKGGVAKTTTAIALADGLSRRNRKVLVIDFDPQGSLTTSFGIEEEDVDNPQSLRFLELEKGARVSAVNISHNLSVITSDAGLERANDILLGKIGRERYLRRAIEKIPPEIYDYIIIDSNPSLSVCTLNVLAASDCILIPVKPEFGSFKGIDLLLENVEAVRTISSKKIEVLGFVVTMADALRASTRQAVKELEARADEICSRVFKSHIRLAVAAADAPSYGKSLYGYAPDSNVVRRNSGCIGGIGWRSERSNAGSRRDTRLFLSSA